MTLLALPDDPALWTVLEADAGRRWICAHGATRLEIRGDAAEFEVSLLSEIALLGEDGPVLGWQRLPLHQGPPPPSAPAGPLPALGVWIAARSAGDPARRLTAALRAVAIGWAVHLDDRARLLLQLRGMDGRLMLRILPHQPDAEEEDVAAVALPAEIADAVSLSAILPGRDSRSREFGILAHISAFVPPSAHARAAAHGQAVAALVETGLPWPDAVLP